MTRSTIWIVLAVASVFVVGVGCSREARMARYLNQAEQFRANNEHEKAIIDYLNVLKLQPENRQALKGIGFSRFAQNDLRGAFPYLQRTVELDPTADDVRLKLATIYLAVGELESARTNVSVILAKEGNNLDALELWASAVATTEQIDEAVARLQAASPTVRDQSKLQLLLGRLYARKSDLASAEQAIRQAQTLAPETGLPHLDLGELYAAKGLTNLAGQELETAVRLSPTNMLALFKLAEFKRQSGDVEESKRLLLDIVNRDPDYIPGWLRLAQLAALEGKFDESVEKIGEALKRQPDSLPAHTTKARIRLAHGETSVAVTELEGLTKRYPQVAEFHYLLGMGYSQGANVAKAIEETQQAVNLATNFVDAVMLLAQLRVRTGQAKEAVKPLQELVLQHPDLIQAHLLLGTAYLLERRFSEAVGAYCKLTELATNSASAFYVLGDAYLAQTNYPAALAAYERALALNPGFAEALAHEVGILVMEGDIAAALARVNRQLERTTNSASLHILLGSIQLKQGDVAKAEKSFLKGIELSPEETSGYRMLAQIYVTNGRVGEAVQVLESALAKKPDDVATLILAGSIFLSHARDYEKARAVYEKVIAVQPDSVLAANNLAVIYLQHLKDPSKAYEFAQRAYKLAPDNASIQDTLGWAAYQRGDYPRALVLLRNSAGSLSNRAEVVYHLGMAQAMVGDDHSAKETLLRALSLGTNFQGAAEAKLMIPVIESDPESVGEPDSAVLQALLSVDPSNSPALLRMALITAKKSKFDEARSLLEALWDRNSSYPLAALYLAEIYSERLDDQEKASSLAVKARNLALESPQVLLRVAAIVHRRGDVEVALGQLSQAGRLAANDAALQSRIAFVYYEMGRLEEARAAGRRSLQLKPAEGQAKEVSHLLEMIEPSLLTGSESAVLKRANSILAENPKFVPARMVVAALHRQKGETEKEAGIYEQVLTERPYCAPALQAFVLLRAAGPISGLNYDLTLKARRLLPEDPRIARALAMLRYERREYRQAMTLLQESARKSEETAQSLHYLGLCRFHLGDKSGAKEALQRAIQLDPGIAAADQAAQILTEQ